MDNKMPLSPAFAGQNEKKPAIKGTAHFYKK
jgi:hypothetical protein